MRVALVSPYALSVHGGVQEQVLAMSRELSRRGHDVLVVAPDGRDDAVYDTPATVTRFGRLMRIPANGSRAPLTLSPLATRRAWFAVTQFAPDVVHFHEPFAPLIGWGVLRVRRAPSVGTFHRSGDGPALQLTRPLLRMFAKDIDVATAVSESAARTVRDSSGLEPVVLFNGFEVERFTQGERIRSAQITLVTIGRLEDRKGVGVAITAVKEHNSRGGEPWHLTVIGDGPESQRLRALAGHDDAISFLGAVSDEEKRRWLRRAHVVVAPALRGESFGLVLLEAMASEASVVASDIDGYRQAAGGHAVLSAPGDAFALEQAITAALENESPGRIEAAKIHAAHWSMSALVDRYEDLYRRAREAHATAR